jgi:NAD(P)-dependent dehydrogenase (short-subunit alcohol dehydrogenase family)
MRKKICIVTGANSGIGFELAKGMAQKNFVTVLLCRNKKSGEAARNKIINYTKNNDVYLKIADLSSQISIRKFAKEYNAQFSHLDVLFNNAGANFFNRQITDDSIEMTFAVNYLASFLLTKLLLPKLKKNDSGKIILTVGGISGNTIIQFDDINFENKYNVIKASSQAILAKLMFCYELSRKLKETNITINCFHPGATKTDLQKKMPLIWKILTGMMRPFFKSAEKAAETGLYLATAEKMENISGKYYKNLKEAKSSKISYDLEIARQLWDVSENMIKQTGNKIP